MESSTLLKFLEAICKNNSFMFLNRNPSEQTIIAFSVTNKNSLSMTMDLSYCRL